MGKTIYSYLIAGLPELLFPTGVKGFEAAAATTAIDAHLTRNDQKLLRLVLMGLKNPSPHFYHTAAKSPSPFIRQYFMFDRALRNAQCMAAARKINIAGEPFCVAAESDTEPLPDDIKQTMELTNILEREQKIDALRWNKASDLTVFNYLDMERILLFTVKAFIVDRWMKMDETTGHKLFKETVSGMQYIKKD